MNRTASMLTFCAMLPCTGIVAQFYPFPMNERPADGWPEETVEFYQPIVMDTTLLFPSESLVWQCVCGWPNEYEFYYDVDWRIVRKCWGRKEVFDRVEVVGQYGFVQRGLGDLHAMLVEGDGGFLYTELPDEDAEPTRTVQLVWDTDQVVRTDTAVVGHWGHEGLVTRITRYVELKRAD